MLWFVTLVLWPLAELFVIIKVSEAIGFLWMLLLLLISWPIGSRVIRHEGRAALRRLREALAAGRTPTNEVLDGALVLIGGLALMVPGFITDVLGLALLLPPARALARRAATRNHPAGWLRRLVGVVSWGLGGRPRERPRRGYDADATAVDIDEPQLGR